MKHLFFALLMMGFISANAQRASENEIKKIWKGVYEAYNAGDYDSGFSFYTDNAIEIGPGGNLTEGKKALVDSWAAFQKMMDTTPKFTYDNLSVRLITKDVAIIHWDQDADIVMGGQQYGGQAKAMAVMRKVNENWFIEADALIPVVPMSAK